MKERVRLRVSLEHIGMGLWGIVIGRSLRDHIIKYYRKVLDVILPVTYLIIIGVALKKTKKSAFTNTITLTSELISKKRLSDSFNSNYSRTIYHNQAPLPLNDNKIILKYSKKNLIRAMTKKARADRAMNNKYLKEELYLQRKYLLGHPITQLLGKSSKSMLAYETFCSNNEVRKLKDFECIPTFERKMLMFS